MILIANCALNTLGKHLFTPKNSKKRAVSLLWFFLSLLGTCGLFNSAQANTSSTQTFSLDQAQALVTVQGFSENSLVQLPYHWDRLHKAQDGEAMFELAFDLPGEPREPYGLYFPRIGTAYEVWLNGTLLNRSGDMQTVHRADFAKAPRYVAIPPLLLQTNNLLRIHIRADGGRRGGLATVTIGPENEVRSIYNAAYQWTVAGALGVAIFSLMVGLLALALWLTQPMGAHALPAHPSNPVPFGPSLANPQGERFRHRWLGAWRSLRDPVYLFAGLAEIAWALRLSDTVIDNPWLPWPWWGILESCAYAAWIACMTSFCQHVAGLQSQRSNWILLGVFASGVVATFTALLLKLPFVWSTWLACAALGFALYGSWYAWTSLRTLTVQMGRPDMARVMVAIAVLINVFAGVRDWTVVRMGLDTYGETSWVRYTSVLFGLSLAYIVVTRFRAASAQARDLMHNLAERVAQKETELAASYHQLETLAREQATAQERTRILRDMHDGVGSHISAAIRQLQSGKATDTQVLQTLRDSLDQLKLSIDSIHLMAGDVTALLANLRYRLEPRFTSSSIAFEWEVDLLPTIARLDHSAMRQLQYMVFEALSNVLQHAGATVLRIEARTVGESSVLRIVDNGRGFDATAVASRGLASMRERSVAIGATLVITSSGAGTCVEIGL